MKTDIDFVNIYNGDNASAPLIASLTGNYTQPPRGFTTTEHFMFVRFTSGNSYGTGGFSATYTTTTTREMFKKAFLFG